MAAQIEREKSLDRYADIVTGSKSINREELRAQSSFLTGHGIVYRDSLQKCDLYSNHCRLLALEEESKRNKAFKKESKLKGLIEVLEHLLLPIDDLGSVKGFMRFDVAYQIFCGHQDGRVDETTFRDALLLPEHGLCIYIVDVNISKALVDRFIVIKSPSFNLIGFLNEIQRLKVNHEETVANDQKLSIERQELHSILGSMDTEWDKTCSKVLFAGSRSIEEIRALGLDPDTMPKHVILVKDIVKEVESSFELPRI